jgi:hypothetical protein
MKQELRLRLCYPTVDVGLRSSLNQPTPRAMQPTRLKALADQ